MPVELGGHCIFMSHVLGNNTQVNTKLRKYVSNGREGSEQTEKQHGPIGRRRFKDITSCCCFSTRCQNMYLYKINFTLKINITNRTLNRQRDFNQNNFLVLWCHVDWLH